MAHATIVDGAVRLVVPMPSTAQVQQEKIEHNNQPPPEDMGWNFMSTKSRLEEISYQTCAECGWNAWCCVTGDVHGDDSFVCEDCFFEPFLDPRFV